MINVTPRILSSQLSKLSVSLLLAPNPAVEVASKAHSQRIGRQWQVRQLLRRHHCSGRVLLGFYLGIFLLSGIKHTVEIGIIMHFCHQARGHDPSCLNIARIMKTSNHTAPAKVVATLEDCILALGHHLGKSQGKSPAYQCMSRGIRRLVIVLLFFSWHHSRVAKLHIGAATEPNVLHRRCMQT